MPPHDDPLTSPPLTEIPLRTAPLVRVIAQIRFPAILSIEKREFIASFQEAIRDQYPVLRNERSQGFVMAARGVEPASTQTVWRFSDAPQQWRASLATDFLALETTSYISRDDFLVRLDVLVSALADYIAPKTIDRLGLRYIDRVEAGDDIGRLLRPEVLGVLASPISRNATHVVSQCLFTVPNTRAQLQASWGTIPANATVDRAAIEPIDKPSWILDLDMFCSEPQALDRSRIISDARDYAVRIYQVFRWAVTDDFLRRYGGDV